MSNFQLLDRAVIGVDVQGFSLRNSRVQLDIMRELDRMLTEAAGAAGLNRADWDRRPEGDGEVAVLPGDVDLLMVVRRFVTELDQRLTDHNEGHSAKAGIRLRIAMNSGSVIPGGILGHGGDALIDLARLLNSHEVRKALDDAPDANLAQIISESLFQRTAVHELGGMRPGQFRKVVVDIPAKGFRQAAYLYLPGGWPQRPAARPPSREVILGPPLSLSDGQSTLLGPKWRKRPPPAPAPDPGEQPEPAPVTVTFGKAVTDLLTELRDAISARDIATADCLTTRIVLEAAGRSREGSLLTSDTKRLRDELLTELDAAWAAASNGAWGFAAQRKRLAGLPAVGPRNFHDVSSAFGWRQPSGTLPDGYAAFLEKASADLPYLPSLRCPDREKGREQAWYGEWRTTVIAVHDRLEHWR